MKRTQAIELPQEEIAKQKEWMAEFAALEDRPRTYCVVTYGCQMNAHDSETLEGMLYSAEIDLRTLLEDQLLMAIPFAPRHEDCNNATLARVNQDQPNPFAKLAGLKSDR